MSDSKLHVAVDLGASGGRVALGWLEPNDLGGTRLEVEILHRFPNGAVPIRGALHWDIVGLWREILHGLRLAGTRGRELGKSVSSIGVDSWAVDFALLDERDEIIGGVRSYRDSRTDGVMDKLLEGASRADVYAVTGLQFLPFNTLYQLLAVRRDAPEQLERARSLLLIPDLLHFWLTGRKVCERTNASTTQFYNPSSRGWARDLLERVGLPQHFLPEIIDAGEVIAPLTSSLASELGLLGAVVVAVGTHDTASAVAAAPLTSQRSAYISSGTWSLVGLETREAVLNDAALSANLTNEAGVYGTNRLLKNVMGLWILQECRRAWGNPDWTDLYAEARDAVTTARVNPDDARYLAPGLDMPQRIAAHCAELEQKTPASRGETVRLILESLAARYGVVLRELELASGVTVDAVHVVGGGSQVALLNELTANATGLPVIAGPVDATLIGNLLVQLESLLEIEAGTGRELVRASSQLQRYEPGGADNG